MIFVCISIIRSSGLLRQAAHSDIAILYSVPTQCSLVINHKTALYYSLAKADCRKGCLTNLLIDQYRSVIDSENETESESYANVTNVLMLRYYCFLLNCLFKDVVIIVVI
jgi:hypothetical protein